MLPSFDSSPEFYAERLTRRSVRLEHEGDLHLRSGDRTRAGECYLNAARLRARARLVLAERNLAATHRGAPSA